MYFRSDSYIYKFDVEYRVRKKQNKTKTKKRVKINRVIQNGIVFFSFGSFWVNLRVNEYIYIIE